MILGMFNYIAKFLPHLSSMLKSASYLLRSDVHWSWGPQQQAAFQEAKQLVSRASKLTYFDPNKPTTVSVEASSYGLGAVLLQQHGKDMKPVACCSRTLTPSRDTHKRKGMSGRSMGMRKILTVRHRPTNL